MLRAIIFDLDGTIVNSEPAKLNTIRQIAARKGWIVSEAEYYRDLLQLEDRRVIEHLYRSHGQTIDRLQRDEVLDWKRRAYAQMIVEEGLPPFPGAVNFVRQLASRYPLAIASGSLQSEVDHLLRKLEIREAFAVLVTADDIDRPKPDPEIYLTALARLQRIPAFEQIPLRAAECLAIEDAAHGIVAAVRAGLRCLALTHSLPSDQLGGADWVFRGFEEVDFARIEAAFA